MKYRIESLADFKQVPPDRMEACLRDFVHWVALYRHSDAWAASLTGSLDVPAGSIQPLWDAFIWDDDGVEGLRHLHFVAADDGRDLGRVDLQAFE